MQKVIADLTLKLKLKNAGGNERTLNIYNDWLYINFGVYFHGYVISILILKYTNLFKIKSWVPHFL